MRGHLLYIVTSFLFLIIGYSSIAQTYRIEYVNFYDSVQPMIKSGTVTLHSTEKSASFRFLDPSEKVGQKELQPKKGEYKTKAIISEIDTNRIEIWKDFNLENLSIASGKGFGFKGDEIYRDSLHNFNWQLLGDTQTIKGYLCFNATCFWRGRTYVAWYAPSIPINNGPWKFGGLPGLITEVFDADSISYWRLSSLTYTDRTIPAIPEVIEGDFYQYRIKFKSNFLKMKKSMEANNDANDPSCAGCKNTVTITINTPERLTEDY